MVLNEILKSYVTLAPFLFMVERNDTKNFHMNFLMNVNNIANLKLYVIFISNFKIPKLWCIFPLWYQRLFLPLKDPLNTT